MYRCTNCEHLFEEGEETCLTESHGFESGPIERRYGCPICGSEYEETTPCKLCFSEQLPDKLYGGLCEDCLRDSITFESFREYLCDMDSHGEHGATGLTHFIFECLLDSSVPAVLGKNAHEAMLTVYNAQRKDPLLMERCERYVMDNGESGRNEYAEWLSEKLRARRKIS